MDKVKENDTVKVHYTGKLTDGTIFDSSLQREPISVTLGQGSLIPGFEKGLIDMQPSERKTITIPKEEAYGEVRSEMFHSVKIEELPGDIKPEVGMGLVATSPDGVENEFRVAEVHENHVVIDANHPLAGQDLTFELELISIG